MSQSKKYPFIHYHPVIYPQDQMLQRSRDYFEYLNKRRTVREFSSENFPVEIIENIIRSASTAPSGAHKQPWTFCVVQNPEIKKQIRIEAEKEEYESYSGRMPNEWLDDLEPLGTDWHKPFLETAPYLIVIFRRAFEIVNGKVRNNYYVNESAGLACGFLLMAIYNAGLVALTHTPSPMKFLSKILNRPENERPFLLIPVGLPSKNTMVPDLKRKELSEVMVKY